MNTWLKVKVWTKISLFVLVLVYLGLFLFWNMDQKVTIWVFFGKNPDVSLIPLIVGVFLAGVIGTLLWRMVFRTIRQLRELKQSKKNAEMQQNVADIKAKADMLQTKPTVHT